MNLKKEKLEKLAIVGNNLSRDLYMTMQLSYFMYPNDNHIIIDTAFSFTENEIKTNWQRECWALLNLQEYLKPGQGCARKLWTNLLLLKVIITKSHSSREGKEHSNYILVIESESSSKQPNLPSPWLLYT